MPERQAAGELVRAVAEADAIELPLRLAEDARLFGAIEPQPGGDEARPRARMSAERDVVEQAHVRAQLDVLERARHAEPRDVPLRLPGHVVAEELHAAGGHRQRAGDEVEHRRLAGAVGTDQADDLARAHVEADVVDRDQAAEALHAHGLRQGSCVPRDGIARRGSGAAVSASGCGRALSRRRPIHRITKPITPPRA